MRGFVLPFLAVAAATLFAVARAQDVWQVAREAYRDDECASVAAGSFEVRIVENNKCIALSSTTSFIARCRIRSGSSKWNVTEYVGSSTCDPAYASRLYAGNDETKCDNSTLGGYLSQSVKCGRDCTRSTTCDECRSWVGCSWFPSDVAGGSKFCANSNDYCTASFATCDAVTPTIPAPTGCTPGGGGGGGGGGTPNGPGPDEYDDGRNNNKVLGAIIGVTLGGVALIGLGFGAYWFYFRKTPPANTTSSGLPHPEAIPMNLGAQPGVTVVTIAPSDSAKLA